MKIISHRMNYMPDIMYVAFDIGSTILFIYC
jgi:hypothetical protein